MNVASGSGGASSVLVARVASCAPTPPAQPPTASSPPSAEATIAAELVDAIDRGDYGLALHALCAGYARLDLPCANTLHLSMLEPSDVMSRISLESHELHMQPMPTDGYAYWDNWSTILAHGAWQPRAWFVDERDARRAANTLLVTVLAHELGHHLADRHHCDGFARPASELRADQLSVPLIGALARADQRLDRLHAQVRAIADAMIEAVPARYRSALPARGDVVAWVEQQADLPTLPGAYAALHLARQRRVLLDPTLDLAPRCAATWHALAAQRQFASAGEVTTLRTLPQPSSAG
ncbi:MAG: hypothetical protein NT062_00735 [Proteobacteria bacterium]|nr:hypothetical protein [Pseudomonadota bacterium]